VVVRLCGTHHCGYTPRHSLAPAMARQLAGPALGADRGHNVLFLFTQQKRSSKTSRQTSCSRRPSAVYGFQAREVTHSSSVDKPLKL
jgi:hypothetical protein